MALPILLGNSKSFYNFFSIKHVTDIPYNPQAQDMIERTHLTLKLQIKKKNLRGNTQEHFYLPYPEQILLDLNTIYSLIL